MANTAQVNQQLFNQAVSLGLSPNFTGKGGGGAYTRYLQALIQNAPRPEPVVPEPPKIPKPITNIEIASENRTRLQTGTRTTRRRASTRTGRRRLTTGLNTASAGGSTGGISF